MPVNKEKRRARQKRWRKSPGGRVTMLKQWRRRYFRQQFGISVEEKLAYIRSAKGLCGICGAPNSSDLDADHSVNPAKIRGILCRRCNMGGGRFNDDPKLLLRAAKWFSK